MRLPTFRPSLDDLLLVLGPIVVTVGIWIVAPFAALIFAGTALTLAGFLIARGGISG